MAKKTNEQKFDFALGKENYILIIIGFAIIIIGFLLMIGGGTPPDQFYPDGDPSKTPEIFSFRRVTLSPVILVFGFLFEIYAIMKKPRKQEQ